MSAVRNDRSANCVTVTDLVSTRKEDLYVRSIGTGFCFHFQTLAPDMDDFRLGVQKCRKTIDDGVGNAGIFRVEGLDSLFKMLRVAAGNFGAINVCHLWF